METKRYFLLFIICTATIIIGCNNSPPQKCKPILFPYIEYTYKAQPRKLAGEYLHSTQLETIDFFNLNLDIPKGWSYERVFAGKTIKLSKGEKRFFLINFHKAKTRIDDASNFKFIGCDAFASKETITTRTDKDFWTDLYLFTSDQLQGEPSFWQYSILWSKTEFLRDATKLIHYKGKDLEAFQRNIKPKSCACGSTRVHIEIFPKKLEPDHLTIIADIDNADADANDIFFADFLYMIDKLNP